MSMKGLFAANSSAGAVSECAAVPESPHRSHGKVIVHN